MKILLPLLLFVACSAGAAFENVTSANYPDADCVFSDGLRETVYEPDGTYVDTDENWVTILTEKGRREEANLTLQYNKRYGEATIDFVSVISPDGTERSVDISATTKESTDNSSASSNIYDPMSRKLVCAIPGVKVGDTIHYKTTRRAMKSRVENAYADICVLEWECPIVRQEVRVIAPAERPLKKIAIRHPLGNVTYSAETRADGRTVHTWIAKDSPQAFSEPDMPPLYGEIQHLRFSTAENWPELSRWYWNLCAGPLEATNPAITNKVTEILSALPADKADTLGKVNAIYKWVAQEIRYMGLTMEDTSPGYAPHDVNITFDNRYGVCRDKAALLVTMLRIAGLDAFPVLIHTSSKMDDEVPLPYFNHAIVAVRAPGEKGANPDGFILMDPTDESSRDLLPSYLSNCSYLVARPEGEPLHTTPVTPAEENALKIKSTGALEKDGSILLSSTIDFLGFNDNVYRGSLVRLKPEERRRIFERIVQNAVPGAETLAFTLEPDDLQDTTKPLRVQLETRLPEAVLRGETRDELTPPLLSRHMGAANWILRGSTSLAKRRFPLVLPSTVRADETLTLRLNGTLGDALMLPKDVAIEGPYAYRRHMAVSNGVFSATRTLALNAVEFSPEEYAEMRENVKRVEALERPRPLFAKDDLQGADIRDRLVERTITFSSPTAWVETNRVEREILTYDGKKSESELTYDFNPTWEQVELVSAVVSNADGRVSAVSEKEVNTFDCGWASSAPRYPASKKLIVNLPSVEVGSTIFYTVVSTVSNSPAAFREVFYRDVTDPTDRLLFTLDGETEEIVHPKLVKSEPLQPDGRLWRDHRIVTKGDFKALAERLKPATEIEPLAWDAAAWGPLEGTGEKRVEGIRNWLARHVRVAGPSLFEVPAAFQVTPPKVVMSERYAARLDYVRTLVALLRGAGFEADLVFASNDAKLVPVLAEANRSSVPNERAFSTPLCRVTADDKTFFLGTENEHTPLGATKSLDSTYFDAARGEFATVTVPEADLSPREERIIRIDVRENGMSDISIEDFAWGPAVGGFRKKYAEMLPEDRKRHHEELLGSVAQAAEATSGLIAETDAYPSRRFFSCVVPDYATVSGDTITLALPEIGRGLFPLVGAARFSPIAFGADEPENLTLIVTFPKSYTELEHLAEDMTLTVPGTDYKRVFRFTSRVEDDRLIVTATREKGSAPASFADKLAFDHAKAMNRLATSRATRTIVVRKK